MNISDLLLRDKATLIRLYKTEIDSLIQRRTEMEVKIKDVDHDLFQKQNILKGLEEELEKEIPDVLDRMDYKWRREVIDYLDFIATSATANAIANYIVARDKIMDIEVAKELRNKIAITCSGLYRDKKLEREGNSKEYHYSLSNQTGTPKIEVEKEDELPF